MSDQPNKKLWELSSEDKEQAPAFILEFQQKKLNRVLSAPNLKDIIHKEDNKKENNMTSPILNTKENNTNNIVDKKIEVSPNTTKKIIVKKIIRKVIVKKVSNKVGSNKIISEHISTSDDNNNNNLKNNKKLDISNKKIDSNLRMNKDGKIDDGGILNDKEENGKNNKNGNTSDVDEEKIDTTNNKKNNNETINQNINDKLNKINTINSKIGHINKTNTTQKTGSNQASPNRTNMRSTVSFLQDKTEVNNKDDKKEDPKEKKKEEREWYIYVPYQLNKNGKKKEIEYKEERIEGEKDRSFLNQDYIDDFSNRLSEMKDNQQKRRTRKFNRVTNGHVNPSSQENPTGSSNNEVEAIKEIKEGDINEVIQLIEKEINGDLTQNKKEEEMEMDNNNYFNKIEYFSQSNPEETPNDKEGSENNQQQDTLTSIKEEKGEDVLNTKNEEDQSNKENKGDEKDEDNKKDDKLKKANTIICFEDYTNTDNENNNENNNNDKEPTELKENMVIKTNIFVPSERNIKTKSIWIYNPKKQNSSKNFYEVEESPSTPPPTTKTSSEKKGESFVKKKKKDPKQYNTLGFSRPKTANMSSLLKNEFFSKRKSSEKILEGENNEKISQNNNTNTDHNEERPEIFLSMSSSFSVTKSEGYNIEEAKEPNKSVFSSRNLEIFDQEQDNVPYCTSVSKVQHTHLSGVDNSVGPIILSITNSPMSDKDYHMVVWSADGINSLQIPGSQIGKSFTKSKLGTLKGVIREKYKLETNLKIIAKEKQTILSQKLASFEQQKLVKQYKFGVLLCKEGQKLEEEMFSNKDGSENFNEFLKYLGDEITLLGWDKYRGGLDNKNGNTGEKSVYKVHKFENHEQEFEIMFHVSTMLPHTPLNDQQLERKRHLGNDIVLIIFIDGKDTCFDPKTIASAFIHVYIVVRPIFDENNQVTHYSITVTNKFGVKSYNPHLPNPNIFAKDSNLSKFLLTKLINAERSCYDAPVFRTKFSRTRKTQLLSYFKDLELF
eukprot:TRINITY_DN2385_c3_g1_i1.p1 TRINITY_DN2385_c3_g1~~TRINITY_DN2385_c3_g1_i1.p1  ORF type:complete len:1002 (+),score=377.78 TRINITY_DN2385_c3_g1_i1:62-3067(+)